jgi:hypothetical protein
LPSPRRVAPVRTRTDRRRLSSVSTATGGGEHRDTATTVSISGSGPVRGSESPGGRLRTASERRIGLSPPGTGGGGAGEKSVCRHGVLPCRKACQVAYPGAT